MFELHLRRRPRRDAIRRGRVTYANVTATLALVIALGGGTAWAANKYLITSTSQIKPSVLRQLHGRNGKNGLNGKNGVNGKNGLNGKNGAVAGYSQATGYSPVAATTDGSYTTDVTKTLPAGNYMTFGKVEFTVVDSVSGGSYEVNCKMVDTPNGGGAATSDIAYFAGSISVPGSGEYASDEALPLQLPVNSPNAASTIVISCAMDLANANGGTLNDVLNYGVISAVQTTTNS